MGRKESNQTKIIGKYHIYTCLKQNFNILATLCSRLETGSSLALS